MCWYKLKRNTKEQRHHLFSFPGVESIHDSTPVIIPKSLYKSLMSVCLMQNDADRNLWLHTRVSRAAAKTIFQNGRHTSNDETRHLSQVIQIKYENCSNHPRIQYLPTPGQSLKCPLIDHNKFASQSGRESGILKQFIHRFVFKMAQMRFGSSKDDIKLCLFKNTNRLNLITMHETRK